MCQPHWRKPLRVICQKRLCLWSSESRSPEENLVGEGSVLFPIFRDLQREKFYASALGVDVRVLWCFQLESDMCPLHNRACFQSNFLLALQST